MLYVVLLWYSPRILQVMLTLKSVRIVMRLRKRAVMRSSVVRSQAGADGIPCGTEDVELLSLVTLFEVDVLGAGKAGEDKDTSSGPGRCMRGRMVVRVRRRGTGTQYVLVIDFVLMAQDCIVAEKAVKASEAASSERILILVSGYGGSGLERAAGAWALTELAYNDLSLVGSLEFVNDRIGGLANCRSRGDEELYNGDAERSDRSFGSRDSLHDECF